MNQHVGSKFPGVAPRFSEESLEEPHLEKRTYKLIIVYKGWIFYCKVVILFEEKFLYKHSNDYWIKFEFCERKKKKKKKKADIIVVVYLLIV